MKLSFTEMRRMPEKQDWERNQEFRSWRVKCNILIRFPNRDIEQAGGSVSVKFKGRIWAGDLNLEVNSM